MAYGTPANVRSHRRGGPRRRRRVAPWITGTLTTVIVLAGLVFGYTQLLARACSGEQSVRVAASPSTAALLTTFARDWHATEPSIADGTCARVAVDMYDSAEVATRLAEGWDETGDAPDVWVPASTAWSQKAAASDLVEPLIPDLRPSIARTPTVIAMPEPMATELDWPDTRVQPDANVRWESLLEAFGENNNGWAQFDRPEWGEFRFGMSNPSRDTAGLLALTAILDSNDDGETSAEELNNAFRLQQLLDPDRYHETTEQLLAQLGEADAEGEEAALGYVSAFPALEQDVLAYNRSSPRVPLAAIYPTNGNIEADHPYLVLNAEWVTPAKQEVAAQFLAWVREPEQQEQLREAGFRSTNREPGNDFTTDFGLVPELVALPRAVLVPESVTLTIDRWTALTQPMNVLILFDVSGSMLEEVFGAGQIRMDQAIEAAARTVELFSEDDQVGFWEFATALNGDLDYRQLVQIGPLIDVMGDGRTRRQHILSAIDGLVPLTDTGLYNTIQAAYDAVLANYDDAATNMVVVLTDGQDDTGGRPGISVDQLLAHVEQAPDEQPVRVVSVAFGRETDFEILRRIGEATGGAAYLSQDGFDLVEVFRTAVFANLD
jgi:Ca-activated chloride channel family protein